MFRANVELGEVPLSLATLPSEILPEIVRWVASHFEVRALDCTSHVFHTVAPRSAVEEGLRLRALMMRGSTVVSSGTDHVAFVGADGQLLTCGKDIDSSDLWAGASHGQASVLGGHVASLVPSVVAGLDGVRIHTVAAGDHHTLACSRAGAVYSFGTGMWGKLGHGDHGDLLDQYTPRRVDALKHVPIVEVAAGAHHSLALSGDGKLYTFGRGGESGHGDPDAHHFTPQLVAALTHVFVMGVASRQSHSLVFDDAGDAYSWGHGRPGVLGHACVEIPGQYFGLFEHQKTPKLIEALHARGTRVCSVSTGEDHTAWC